MIQQIYKYKRKTLHISYTQFFSTATYTCSYVLMSFSTPAGDLWQTRHNFCSHSVEIQWCDNKGHIVMAIR